MTLATLQILLAPDFVLHVPTSLPCPGQYRGWEGGREFWKRMAQQGQSALEVRVLALLDGSDHAAILGAEAEDRRLYLMRLEEGRVAECWIYCHPTA